MKLKQKICDLCGEPVNKSEYQDYKVTIKRHWYSMGGEGYAKLDICGDCMNKLIHDMPATKEGDGE